VLAQLGVEEPAINPVRQSFHFAAHVYEKLKLRVQRRRQGDRTELGLSIELPVRKVAKESDGVLIRHPWIPNSSSKSPTLCTRLHPDSSEPVRAARGKSMARFRSPSSADSTTRE
jgi:hypothetical protein